MALAGATLDIGSTRGCAAASGRCRTSCPTAAWLPIGEQRSCDPETVDTYARRVNDTPAIQHRGDDATAVLEVGPLAPAAS